MHSALIIGGDSAIGSALASTLRADGVKVHVTSRRSENKTAIQLDLAGTPATWGKLPQAEVAYLCAGVTALEACEANPEMTALINVTHLQTLATQLFLQNTRVVFLSSNQVFDGSKPYPSADKPPCPLNVYGKQKAAFETWLMAQIQMASVLRLTKIVTARLPVLESWTSALKKGEPIQAFDDLVFAPLAIESALKALIRLGSEGLHGIFQLSGTRDISYYEVASMLATRMSVDTARVIRTRAKDAGIRPQFLPRHATLQPSKEFADLLNADVWEVLFPKSQETS